jgi:phenylacetate-CoA ligase
MLASERPRAASISQSPLAKALFFAMLYSPYYRTQAWAVALREGRKWQFRNIPITPNSLVKENPSSFYSVSPADQGEVSVKHTSGSTGEPLEVRVAKRCALINRAENKRLCEPWNVAAHKRVVHARDPRPGSGTEERHLSHGRRQWKLYSTEGQALADLLKRSKASFVTGLPSVLHNALECGSGLSALRLLGTVGEIVSDEFRQLVTTMPGCRLFDSYGCVEAGIIAAQCPLCNAYHPADRQLALELVDDDGSPTPPGGMGRILVTPYFNQAMPLIRYDLGDYAVRSQSNVCPNGEFSLERIIGRRKNLFTLPNGRKFTPFFPAKIAHDLGIRRFKMVQVSVDHIEVRYIPRTDGDEISQEALQNIADTYISPTVKMTPVKVSDIPRATSGKYLMHESLVE